MKPIEEIIKRIKITLNSKTLIKALYHITLGMVGALLIVIFVAKPFSSSEPMKLKIFVVDITGIVDNFVKTQSSLNLPIATLHERARLFSTELEQALNQVAAKNHAILMPTQAVLAGAVNITDQITNKLDKAMAIIDTNKNLSTQLVNLTDKQEE
jgi:hypothetical protein